MSAVQRAIEAARFAVVGRAGEAVTPDRGGGFFQPPNLDPLSGSGTLTPRADRRRVAAPPVATVRPSEPPAPRRWRPVPVPVPAGPPRPPCGPGELLGGLVLSEGAEAVLQALYEVGAGVLAGRPYRRCPDTLVFHGVKELLAAVLGMGRTTLWRHLAELKTLGVLDERPHKGTSRGVTRNTGTVFKLALRPGLRVRLLHEELHHAHRDLDADRAAGRTAWALKQSGKDLKGRNGIKEMVGWALSELHFEPLVVSDRSTTAEAAVHALPDLVAAHPKDRPALVAAAADALCLGLRDGHSRGFYIWMLDKAVKAEFQGVPMLTRLQHILRRVLIAARPDEWGDGLRRPGALLVAELGDDLDMLRAA